jgi:membrane associated rhomboid family serine protease
MFAMPPVTRALILLNLALYVLERLFPEFMRLFALWPLGNPMFHPWQLLSYAFLHDPQTFLHIFLNMFALYMFGRSLETYWGGRRFLIYYLICALAAGITQLATTQPDAPYTVGASGGVFGVLLAFAWYFPKVRLFVIPVPIPLPAWLVVTVYALLELIFGITGTQQSVAHFAHLGGMLGGVLCILYWRARRQFSS